MLTEHLLLALCEIFGSRRRHRIDHHLLGDLRCAQEDKHPEGPGVRGEKPRDGLVKNEGAGAELALSSLTSK